jgi:hydrogenase maturation protein HypF
VFETVVADLQKLYGVSARQVVCDAHPGYSTHRWAMDCGLEVTKTWHHLAHASALVAEQPADGDWLVFTWDGVGLGPDGTLWGGEALHGQPGHWRRVASMRPFRLPGGERAGRQPWRSAAALYWECGLELNDDPDTDGLAKTAWRRRLNTPETTAVGRLFDAASAVVCGANNVSYEAQGPMQLEALCRGAGDRVRLDQYVDEGGIVRADWAPLIPMLEDNNWSEVARAESFHSSMAHALLEQVRHVATAKEFRRVGLCGGVFQNRVLTEQVMQLLESDGYEVIISKTLPCNDAAISFGQVAEFAAGNIAREH